jgi:pimeloyl-ACP methyl ester carboxylesterase
MSVLLIAMSIAASIAAGLLYQWRGKRRDARLYPPPGRMVGVGRGRRLHLYEMGSGGPAVILEAGLAATSLNWTGLQKELAGFTRAVAYDRGGLGWSDPCGTPRTPSYIAAELHDLLQAARVEPPYVLVGHSFGGLVVRRYALLYREEVAGLVLVDPLWPEEADRQRCLLALGIRLSRRAGWMARFGLVRLGAASLMAGSRCLPRVIARAASGQGCGVVNRIAAEAGKLPREVWPIIAAHWSNPRSYAGIAAHLEALPGGVEEMRDAPVAGVPVTVLTAGRNPPVSDESIRTLGPDVRHVVAEESGHWIHLDQPELVVEAVQELAARIFTPACVTRRSAGVSTDLAG